MNRALRDRADRIDRSPSRLEQKSTRIGSRPGRHCAGAVASRGHGPRSQLAPVGYRRFGVSWQLNLAA
jgi:hypothetical protein